MGQAAPLISVVMAAYQHAPFVERAVRSVLEQTVADLELIVIDDASTDGTADIVEAIQDPRLRLLRAPANRAWHSRNKGIALSRGRFVAFQNSDDEWLPDKLAAQLDALSTSPGAVAAFTEVECIDADGKPLPKSWASRAFDRAGYPESPHAWLRLFFERNVLCISSALVERAALARCGPFKVGLLQVSDLDLWIRLSGQGLLVVVPRRLTRMRILDRQNLSAPTPAARCRAALEVADLLEEYLRSPLFEQLEEIFPDVALPDPSQPVLRRASFARFCSAQGIPHRLFADRVLSGLLNDPASGAILQDAYGGDLLKAFWAARGQLKVVDAERYASRTRSFWHNLKARFRRSR